MNASILEGVHFWVVFQRSPLNLFNLTSSSLAIYYFQHGFRPCPFNATRNRKIARSDRIASTDVPAPSNSFRPLETPFSHPLRILLLPIPIAPGAWKNPIRSLRSPYDVSPIAVLHRAPSLISTPRWMGNTNAGGSVRICCQGEWERGKGATRCLDS